MTGAEQAAIRDLVRQVTRDAHDAGVRTAAEMVRKSAKNSRLMASLRLTPLAALEALAQAIEAATQLPEGEGQAGA